MAQIAPEPERAERPVQQLAGEGPVERHVFMRAAGPMNPDRPIDRWAMEPVNPQELVNGRIVDNTQRAINRWAVDHVLATTEQANTGGMINRQATEPANDTPGSII